MDSPGIEAVLARAEEAVARGEGLGGTGFARVVGRVKKNPELAERYGTRIARIDLSAFRQWALIVVPLAPGTALALAATVGGLALIGWSYSLTAVGSLGAALTTFFAGLGVLIVTTHGLGHLLVGRMLGIHFAAWFVGSLGKPQPGVKIDYATYLRSTPERRAWMHAAGAIVTKLVPFALVGAALAAGLPPWVAWGLVGLGIAMVVTDIVWSTKSSDWSRFRREMRLA